MLATLERFGGILVQPRRTLEALRSGPSGVGRHDGLALILAYVLGSQIERMTAALATFEVIRSFAMLLNALAIALLAPILVALLVEALAGTLRARYRHLPLAALVLVSTLGTLLRHAGIALPGPTYLPEILGTLWAAGLALWIRRTMPAQETT